MSRSFLFLSLLILGSLASYGGGPSNAGAEPEVSTIIHQLPDFLPEEVRKLLLPAIFKSNAGMFGGKAYECFVQSDGAFELFEIEISVGELQYFPISKEHEKHGLWTIWKLIVQSTRLWRCSGKIVPVDKSLVPGEEQKAIAFFSALPDEKFKFWEIKWEPVVTDLPVPDECECNVLTNDGKLYASFHIRTDGGLRFDCFGNRPCSVNFLKALVQQKPAK